jgi:3-oxoacyl-(acyl-carrier-protein) synthase
MFNCHATSTPKGDASEASCIKSILFDKAIKIEGQSSNPKYTAITANKGNIGHMVAGAAITESIFAM